MRNPDERDQKRPWDEIKEPRGDLDAARTIRAICKSAAAESEQTRRFMPIGTPQNDEPKSQRCARAAKAAMELALKITDPLVRDSAVRQIIDLCMISGEVKAAQILIGVIQSESTRREALSAYPALHDGQGTGAAPPR